MPTQNIAVVQFDYKSSWRGGSLIREQLRFADQDGRLTVFAKRMDAQQERMLQFKLALYSNTGFRRFLYSALLRVEKYFEARLLRRQIVVVDRAIRFAQEKGGMVFVRSYNPNEALADRRRIAVALQSLRFAQNLLVSISESGTGSIHDCQGALIAHFVSYLKPPGMMGMSGRVVPKW